MEKQEENNDNLRAYNLLSFDKVFILLHSPCTTITNHPNILYFDRPKNRYYLMGRVVRLEVTNFARQGIESYPKFNSLAFVDERDYSKYKSEKKDYLKPNYIKNIFYTDIDFITIDFNILMEKR